MPDDRRLVAPSAARNREPILDVLRLHLPATGKVLEVASGTGEHVVHFARMMPRLVWQPTDPAAEACASIDAWAADVANVLPACNLDAASPVWPVKEADAVLCINMIHIAPWTAAIGLIAGAARTLRPGGLLALYGAYRRAGKVLEPGNAEFDADLRSRDPAWGLRDVDAVASLAADAGFGSPAIVAMPSNNLMVLFRRR